MTAGNNAASDGKGLVAPSDRPRQLCSDEEHARGRREWVRIAREGVRHTFTATSRSSRVSRPIDLHHPDPADRGGHGIRPRVVRSVSPDAATVLAYAETMVSRAVGGSHPKHVIPRFNAKP